MNARKFIFMLLIGPFVGLLTATKLSVWLAGKELLVDSDALGRFLLVSILIGLVVVVAVRSIFGCSLLSCVVAGIIVFGALDVLNMAGLVHIYREDVSTAGVDPALGLAKLAGGIVYGLCFWFFNPFAPETRQSIGPTLRRGGLNDGI